MAAKTYWFTPYPSVGFNGGIMNETTGGSATLTTTGWTVAKTAPTEYAWFQIETENASFSASPLPSGTNPVPYGAIACSGSTPTPLTGDFEAGTWNLYFSVAADTAGGSQDGRIRAAFFKSPSADGTGGSYISGTLTGSTVTDLDAGVANAQTSLAQWSCPGVTFSNEYLFVTIAWEITGAGGSNKSDVMMIVGLNNTRLVTSNFVVPLAASGSLPTVTVSTIPSATASLGQVQLYLRTLMGVGK